jgi:hypothetical protein
MEDIIHWVIMTFGAAILSALTGILAKAFQFLAEKVKIQKISSIIGRIDDLAIRVVGDVHQTYVKSIKASNADGKLTEEEKELAKKMALDKLKSYLGPKGLGELQWLITGDETPGQFLASVIENILDKEKKAAAAPLN